MVRLYFQTGWSRKAHAVYSFVPFKGARRLRRRVFAQRVTQPDQKMRISDESRALARASTYKMCENLSGANSFSKKDEDSVNRQGGKHCRKERAVLNDELKRFRTFLTFRVT